MSRTAYPGITDLDTFLFASGLITPPAGSATRPQDVLDLGAAMFSAIAEWERGTGWVPFLSGASTTRTYDPPGPERGPVGIYVGVNNMGGGRRLFLNAGVRAITTLKVGVSLTNAGTTLTANQDYWLRPQNATTYDRPYTYVEFTYPQWGNPQSITVTAAFGFGPSIPADVWQSLLRMAAIECVPQLELAAFGGLISWNDADAGEKYNARPYGAMVDSWQAQIGRVRDRYKRKITA